MAIVSASRRTDLPAFYIKETAAAFKKGSIELPNPVTGKPYTVSLKREDVSCIVWWSKDYSNYLMAGDEARDLFKQYNQVFQFTINGYSDRITQMLLEPGVATDLDARIRQARMLADIYSPEQVLWRFDPITTWKDRFGIIRDNTLDFDRISKKLGLAGIKRCQVAFADLYAKSKRRAANRLGNALSFFMPTLEERKAKVAWIASVNKDNGIKTFSCAHADIVDEKAGIYKSSCIDGELISSLFHEKVSLAKDPSQRADCGCVASRDIGSYSQRCHHSCTLCYANPDEKN